MHRILFLFPCLIWKFADAETDPQAHIQYWENLAAQRLREKLEVHPQGGRLPKNVIFFLGDGMGSTVLTGARRYRAQKHGEAYLNQHLKMENFEFTGLVKTSSYDKHVTDSAAGAVALFTGHKALQKSLGSIPGNATIVQYPDGNSPDCTINTEYHINDGIAELSIDKGKNAGFVTTTRITHATPAALYAKGVNRYVETDDKFKDSFPSCHTNDIAKQILQHPADKFKVLMGGGSSFFSPERDGGKRRDQRDIDKEWLKLDGKREIVRKIEDLESIDITTDQKVLGLFSPSHFPYYLDEQVNKVKTVPRLAEMTKKAIQIMEKNNPNGYFLMIEGGHIDMAEHLNELRKSFEEVLEFDDAIEMAKNLTDPSETLIIVTADHSHALSMPGYMNVSAGILENDITESGDHMPGFLFASGPGQKTPRNYSKAESEKHDFASPSYIYMESGYHGGEDVPLYAHGPYAWLFSGSLENTEVAYRIKYLMCLTNNIEHCGDINSQGFLSRIDSGTLATITVLSLAVASVSLLASLVLSCIVFCRNYQSKGKTSCFSMAS